MTVTTTILSTNVENPGPPSGGPYTDPAYTGGSKSRIALVDFNISSYTTGGETLPTAASLGMTAITAVFAMLRGTSATTLNPVLRWDSAGGKLLCIGDATVATQTLSTVAIGSVYLLIVGF